MSKRGDKGEPGKGSRRYRRERLGMRNRAPVELSAVVAVRDGKPVFAQVEASVRAPKRVSAGRRR